MATRTMGNAVKSVYFVRLVACSNPILLTIDFSNYHETHITMLTLSKQLSELIPYIVP